MPTNNKVGMVLIRFTTHLEQKYVINALIKLNDPQVFIVITVLVRPYVRPLKVFENVHNPLPH